MARGHRCASGSAVPLLDHVPDRALRPHHPRRLFLPATLSPSDPISLAQAHQATIDALWDWEDPTASEGRFQAAADAASGVERDVMLTQVARVLGLQKRIDEAGAVLADVATDAHEPRVRVLLERGRVLNSSGSPAEARPLFEAAFSQASEAGLEHLAIDALHMVAIVAPAAEQDTLNGRALALAAAASDPRAQRWRASLLNNLGWSAFERGDYPAALARFEDALAERVTQGQAAEILIARWCVGRTLRALGRRDEALDLQRSLAAELHASGKTDPYVDAELAELLK